MAKNHFIEHHDNFFHNHRHYDKVEDVKVYDKDGNLIKKVSAEEQLEAKWKLMGDNPLTHSAHPSKEPSQKKKLKKGQHKNRKPLKLSGSFNSYSKGKIK